MTTLPPRSERRTQHAAPARLLFVLTLFGVLCAPTGGQELGRLFFTPEQRQNLDRQRQRSVQEQRPPREDPRLTINGVVSRSSGKRTVWINGVAQSENQGSVAVVPRRGDPGKVLVQAGDAPAATARVGDTINRTTGETTDQLNGGRITRRLSSGK